MKLQRAGRLSSRRAAAIPLSLFGPTVALGVAIARAIGRSASRCHQGHDDLQVSIVPVAYRPEHTGLVAARELEAHLWRRHDLECVSQVAAIEGDLPAARSPPQRSWQF